MLRKLRNAVVTLFVAATITFFLVQVMPGDPIYTIALELAAERGIPIEEAYTVAAAMFGGVDPDLPMYRRYAQYIISLLQGDLGWSYLYRISVNKVILEALPWTLLVVSISTVISFSLGSIIGLTTAWKRKSLLNPLALSYASLADALPPYIAAIVVFAIFAVRLGWFPLGGAFDTRLDVGWNLPFILSCLYHAALPVIAFSVSAVGAWILIVRGSATNVLGEDYIYAATARGLKGRRIFLSYVGRNAILPPITLLAITFAVMLGGAVFIENIFRYPGIGFFFAEAVMRRDHGMMQGLFLLTTFGIIVANLIVDLIYPILDPRVRE
ncbi:ABC transporter permease [Candidatus Bipolaricaulota bacterium]|nr:ABC transporter permease [Candidatus Bipolaricaulota bacterium]